MSQRFVAYADSLGFRALVEGNSPATLAAKYQQLLLAAEIGAAQGRYAIDDGGVARADITGATVNMLTVSDSIFMWTDDASAAEFTALVLTVGKFIVSGLGAGFPMRAGIALGDLQTLDMASPTVRFAAKPIFGAALVDAVACEEKQQWAGAVVRDDAIAAYEADLQRSTGQRSILGPLQTAPLVRYDVPTRDGIWADAVALSWSKFNRGGVNADMVTSAFHAHGRPVDEGAQQKLINTLAFLDATSPPRQAP